MKETLQVVGDFLRNQGQALVASWTRLAICFVTYKSFGNYPAAVMHDPPGLRIFVANGCFESQLDNAQKRANKLAVKFLRERTRGFHKVLVMIVDQRNYGDAIAYALDQKELYPKLTIIVVGDDPSAETTIGPMIRNGIVSHVIIDPDAGDAKEVVNMLHRGFQLEVWRRKKKK